MNRTHKIYLPTKGMGMHTLTGRTFGRGIGAVILDGGLGGQSSYPGGIEEMLHTTSRPKAKTSGRGVGLDKLTAKLGDLNIKPPDRGMKKKPISFSI